MTNEQLLFINEKYLAEVLFSKGEEFKSVMVDIMLLIDKSIQDANRGITSHIKDCVQQDLESRGYSLEGCSLELSKVKDMWEKIINEKDHSDIIASAKAIRKFNKNLAKVIEISKDFSMSHKELKDIVDFLQRNKNLM